MRPRGGWVGGWAGGWAVLPRHGSSDYAHPAQPCLVHSMQQPLNQAKHVRLHVRGLADPASLRPLCKGPPYPPPQHTRTCQVAAEDGGRHQPHRLRQLGHRPVHQLQVWCQRLQQRLDQGIVCKACSRVEAAAGGGEQQQQVGHHQEGQQDALLCNVQACKEGRADGAW